MFQWYNSVSQHLTLVKPRHIVDAYVVGSGMVGAYIKQDNMFDRLMEWHHWFDLNFFIAAIIGSIRLIQLVYGLECTQSCIAWFKRRLG